jgi:demethoxyubiquinone hydroxylase (CLK1/Coq7/Cat5 family)
VQQGQQRRAKGTSDVSTAVQDTIQTRALRSAHPVNLANTHQQVERRLAQFAKRDPTLLSQLQHSATYAMQASSPLMGQPSVRVALRTPIH